MALYHDVGKVEIAQQIWTMPCRLAPEEYALMTAHTFFGARILLNTVLLPAARTQRGLEFRAAMADCCLCHHERWDGTGYPLGLAGERHSLSRTPRCHCGCLRGFMQLRLQAVIGRLCADTERFAAERLGSFLHW